MTLKKKVLAGLLAVGLLGTSVLAGCGAKDASGSKTSGADYPKKAMEFIAPGGAGGGWDLTIRTVSKVLQDTKLSPVPTPITNRPGGGGSVNLAYMQEKEGSDGLISVYSSPLLLTNLNGTTELTYKDTTPLARLIADYAVFVVKADSEYKSINDVMDALKKDPKSVKIGGSSSVGSMDHIQFLMIAKAAGIDNIKDIDYISFQEGVNTQLLGGHIDLLSTGLSEVKGLVESGDMRALAQTADHRVGTGVTAEIPTCMEEGIEGTFVNWRGLFGPPEMPEYAVEFWANTLDEMVNTTEWKEASERNGWDDAYQKADEFTAFLGKVNKDYEEILSEIGMLKKK